MQPTDRRIVLLAAGLDGVSVIVFVAVGRRSHDEGSALRGIVETALPFLIGLAVAWLAARAWKRPLSMLTGLLVWPITVLVGMVARRTLFDNGTATSFVIVATVFLGACFLGWRLARSTAVTRRRAAATG
jgi:Protein of unknown function (DUF3054)